MNRFFLSTVFTGRTFTKRVLVSWGLSWVLVLLATLPTSAMPINPNNYGTHRNLWPLTYGNWWEFREEMYSNYNSTSTECGNPDNTYSLLTVEPPDGTGRFLGSRMIHSYKENPCVYHGTVADRNHDGTVTDEWRMQISHNTGTNVRWTIPHPKDETDFGLNTLYMQLQNIFLTPRTPSNKTSDSVVPYLTSHSGSRNYVPDYSGWSSNRNAYYEEADHDIEPSAAGVRVSDKGGILPLSGVSNSVRGYDFLPLTNNVPEQADTANDIIPDAVYASFGGPGKTQTDGTAKGIFPHGTRRETTGDSSGLWDGINIDFAGLKQNLDITRNPDDNDGLVWHVEYRDNVGLWDIPYYSNGVYAFEIDILETSIKDVTDNDGYDTGVCESWYFVDGAGPVKIQNSHFEIPDISGGTFNRVAQQYLNDCFKWTSYTDNRPAYNECNGGCNDNNDPYEWSYTGKLVLTDRYVAHVEDAPVEPTADFHMDPPNAMTGINWNVNQGFDDAASDEMLYFSNGLAWVYDLNRGTLLWSGLATDILSTSSLDYVRVENCAGCGGSLIAPWDFNGPDAVVYSPPAVQAVFPGCVGTTTGNACNIIVFNGDSSLPDYGGNGAVWSGYFDPNTHTVDWADKSTRFTGQLTDVFPNAPSPSIGGQTVRLYDGQGIEAMTNPDWSDSYIVLTRAGAYWYVTYQQASPYVSWPYSGDLGAAWNSAAPNLYDMDGPADPDAMMVFKNNEGFTDSPPQTENNKGIEAVPSSTQWILAQGPAFWVKYDGPNWETWNVCEVGPENECP